MDTTTHPDKTVTDGTNHGTGRRRSLWKRPAIIAALLLLFPLWGNHYVAGWNWAPGGFVVVGLLLFGIGVGYELLTRNCDAFAFKCAMAMAVATMFLLTWGSFVQMADVNRAAALYFAVPLVGIIGAALARLRPNGMSRAMFATALTHAAVLTCLLTMQLRRNPEVATWAPPEMRGFIGNAIVLILFAVSAWLFRKSGR